MIGARILIVDDHRLFADVVGSALEQLGAEIVGQAHTAVDAVDMAARDRPDIVLLDLRLPDGSGLDVGRQILSANPSTIVVALTADTGAGVAREVVRAGFRGYIPKDTRISAVVDGIRGVLDGKVVVIPAPRAGTSGIGTRGDSDAPLVSDLTERERQVLELIVAGAPSETIADRLGISRNTVRTHVQSVLTKLQVHSRLEAAAFAVRYRLVEPGNRFDLPA